MASGPLTGPAQGELAPGVQSPELTQIQSQLLAQFPQLANASPEEQREIAMQVLGLSDRERGAVMTPTTAGCSAAACSADTAPPQTPARMTLRAEVAAHT